ncbi:MAG: hypothetical protein HY690_19790 [Chloroflexi bacterium]|nr:hypothetical protein [Chloroflexota bacterium]
MSRFWILDFGLRIALCAVRWLNPQSAIRNPKYVLALASLALSGPVLDLEAYRGLVAQVEVAVEAARQAPVQEQVRVARAEAQRLRAVEAVRLGEATVAPQHPALLRALEADPPDLDAALVALGALRRALAAPPRPEAEQLGLLDSILARPEFQPEIGLGPLELLAAVVLYVRRTFMAALVWLGESLLGQAAPGVVVVGGLAAGLVAAAALFVGRSLRGSLVVDLRPPASRDQRARLRSQGLWLEGQQLAARGDARSAIHALFLSAALHLDELGLLPFDPSLTNREHLARLARPDLRPLLEPLVATFDTLWYSHARCERVDVEHIQHLAAQVRSVTQ